MIFEFKEKIILNFGRKKSLEQIFHIFFVFAFNNKMPSKWKTETKYFICVVPTQKKKSVPVCYAIEYRKEFNQMIFVPVFGHPFIRINSSKIQNTVEYCLSIHIYITGDFSSFRKAKSFFLFHLDIIMIWTIFTYEC